MASLRPLITRRFVPKAASALRLAFPRCYPPVAPVSSIGLSWQVAPSRQQQVSAIHCGPFDDKAIVSDLPYNIQVLTGHVKDLRRNGTTFLLAEQLKTLRYAAEIHDSNLQDSTQQLIDINAILNKPFKDEHRKREPTGPVNDSWDLPDLSQLKDYEQLEYLLSGDGAPRGIHCILDKVHHVRLSYICAVIPIPKRIVNKVVCEVKKLVDELNSGKSDLLQRIEQIETDLESYCGFPAVEDHVRRIESILNTMKTDERARKRLYAPCVETTSDFDGYGSTRIDIMHLIPGNAEHERCLKRIRGLPNVEKVEYVSRGIEMFPYFSANRRAGRSAGRGFW